MSGAVVTLLTDFGTRDPFVGVMKGAVLAACPGASIVDLTHEIEPQRVRDAAFWLGAAYPWFGPGTVHLAVVDPGVGSARRALVVRADGQLFVAPDNGLLEVVRRKATRVEARLLDPAALGILVRSRTFHGRDLFAPVAGRLAAGTLSFEDAGIVVAPLATALVPEPHVGERSVDGEVVLADRFGNLVTNVEAETLTQLSGSTVRVAGRELAVVGTYADLRPGGLGAVVGSFGQLELVCRDGSAAKELAIQSGARVRVDW
jgi:S-adenosyl-L-methionine hydrolase (adenosine-forming)